MHYPYQFVFVVFKLILANLKRLSLGICLKSFIYLTSKIRLPSSFFILFILSFEGLVIRILAYPLEHEVTHHQWIAFHVLISDKAAHIHVVEQWLMPILYSEILLTSLCLTYSSEKYSP